MTVFGKAILDGVKLALTKHNETTVATGSFARNTLDVAHAIETVRAAKPDAVILASPYAPAAEIVKHAHGQGWHPLFLAVSFIGTEAFITAAGKEAEGVVITQVVPTYDDTELSAVRGDCERLAKYMSGTQPSFVSFEAFVNAMVIAEGLKRAGEKSDARQIHRGHRVTQQFRYWARVAGAARVSAHHHKGLGHVYPTVVRGGKPEVFSEWETVLARK